MKASEILKTLREKRGLTQEQLAARVLVTRQAVSRWETGETQPCTETLKLLSRELDASINTLLGAPRKMVCQCCGMPLSDLVISEEPDGTRNAEYCKWCYSDGKFTYTDLDALIDVCVTHMPEIDPAEARAYLEALLPTLNYWRERAK